MNNKTLVNAIKGSIIHKKIGIYIRNEIKPSMTLHNIVKLIENKIKEETKFDINYPLDGGIAFPIGVSLNNCAAHYTPNYNDSDILLQNDDIIKIDYGIHIKGTIIDSAFTLHFNPKFDEFIQISKNLTNYAVSLCKPDAILGEIGQNIEEYINSKEIIIDNKIYKLNIMKDLSGHMIKQYQIHAGVAVPNIAIDYPIRMKIDEYYAIEPFITTGYGKSIIKNPISHYMLNKNHMYFNNLCESEIKLYDIIKKNYSTLPFCQRWLHELYNISDVDLNKLVNQKIIDTFPPLYDIKDSIISQFEHTIYVKENGIINLTKNDFY